jgi:hypothetical protein
MEQIDYFHGNDFRSHGRAGFSDKGAVISSLPRRTAIAAATALALLTAGCHHAPDSGSDPQPAADAFFATLETGNARGAYDASAFAFQTGQTFDGFLSNAEDLSLIGGQPPQWSSKDLQDSQATLKGTLVNHVGSAIPISVTMTREDGTWKLFSLQTSTAGGDGGQENRFTSVGKGSGFNDVYHQPMPGPKQLDALVHKSMAQFNDAIRRGDFTDFYNGLSEQWKTGRRSTGAIMEGVTPNILKNHFQGFIDKKIDLSPVANSTPVYDAPPHIDQDGLLVAQGHFDVPPMRVEFSLGYAYELPSWKLVSINFGIREQ